MSFKSVMKGIGKVALKAAPIAAAFIPGVGPLASMAISAASNAASKKIEGGSWKDAALAGGIGAGTGYLGGAAKGIGPSAGAAGKAATAGKALSTADRIKGIAGSVIPAMSAMAGQNAAAGIGPTNADALAAGASRSGIPSTGTQPFNRQTIGMGYGLDQRNPNLADFINQGRREGIKNQPFRRGYDINLGVDEAGNPVTHQMPRIYSNTDAGRGIGGSRFGGRGEGNAKAGGGVEKPVVEDSEDMNQQKKMTRKGSIGRSAAFAY